jgi:phosphoglucomutase
VDALAVYQAWLNDPLIDEATKAELHQLRDNQVELADRFFGWLEFGTGGMRGKIGAGTNRMNVYTVRLATQALANTLLAKGNHTKGVAIAYDSRRMSKEFAETAAQVLVGNGIPVYLFTEIAPTPLLSFAVRHHGTAAGLVITASHNPPEYNGYKAYNSRGVQMLPEEASQISQQMKSLSLEAVQLADDPANSPLWHEIGEETISAYYEAALSCTPAVDPGDLNLLYTPLHGTGARFVPEMLARAGFRNVRTAQAQMVPDGSFPTLPLPNPEEQDAFALSMELAKADPCDLILATDPDADRVGVAVWDGEKWHLLNGNQVGVLLTDFLLANMSPAERDGGVIVKTIVTTEMVVPIAQKYGVEVTNTLTGFKYIGELMDELPKAGKHFIFGFEESYGYLAGTAVRDKDAVLTSVLVAKMAAHYKRQGKSLVHRLDELMAEHGCYLEGLRSYSFSGSVEAQRAREFIAQLREEPLREIAGEQVEIVRDYGRSVQINLVQGGSKPIDLPKEDVIQWLTDKESKITIRPSGTEPKMKLYLGVKAGSASAGRKRLGTLESAFDALIQAGLRKE